ncbi:glycosyltransferase family 2 protein [Psychroflexus aestuariivivens]|uniref:glycosyltransferase family 2 protein n=1 Tax=Psychroflexus aestuariivivens TaxID=1795040 RepID=UPI000FD80D9A|nr:glycosyltransferase family 2 protein [Psychroflexus aestuariivivens]
MKVAVVVLNWNGKPLLEEFLPSVVNNSPEAEIYVADNASTDDSIEYLKENFPKVKIIQNAINGGYAKGYNDALKSLTESIFVLLNSDVEVTNNWLKPIVSIFENQSDVAAIQPKIKAYSDKTKFEYAGAAGGFLDEYAYPFCRGRIFDHTEIDRGQYDHECDIFWASGACFAIRREVYEHLNGFDEDYFAHQEEIDLCWRIHQLGKQVKFTPESTVYHLGGGTLQSSNPRKTFYNFRNSLFNILKNTSEKTFRRLFFRLLLDAIAGLHFLSQGRFRHFSAILQAHFSFYKYFFKIKAKRSKNSNFKKYYYIKSIVWHNFVLGKKHFNLLKSNK